MYEHIRKESHNYTRPCYVMKMDIRGYFMHINRFKLLHICLKSLDKMARHKVSKHRLERWIDVVDIGFVKYLTSEIVLLNPIVGCRIIGPASEWDDLPHDKSLFNSPEGCGLPIGNLTSQLFSNVYLNELDQFMKRVLKCRHYGRYVDDFYAVSNCKEKMLSLVTRVRGFLLKELDLVFHDGKLCITSIWHGAEFLGSWLKPHRIYASRETVCRMRPKLRILADTGDAGKYYTALNSYCGVLSHWNNYKLRRSLLLMEPAFTKYGVFNMEYTKYQAVA